MNLVLTTPSKILGVLDLGLCFHRGKGQRQLVSEPLWPAWNNQQAPGPSKKPCLQQTALGGFSFCVFPTTHLTGRLGAELQRLTPGSTSTRVHSRAQANTKAACAIQFLKMQIPGARESVRAYFSVRNTGCSCRERLTAIWNSRARGSGALFRLLRVLHAHNAQLYEQVNYSYTHKTVNTIFKI